MTHSNLYPKLVTLVSIDLSLLVLIPMLIIFLPIVAGGIASVAATTVLLYLENWTYQISRRLIES